MSARAAAVAAAVAAGAALLFGAGACGRRGAPAAREFAVVLPGGPADAVPAASFLSGDFLDDADRRLWRIAARAAAEVAGPAPDGPPVAVRWEPPPARGGDGVLGETRDGGILVVSSPDPLKTASRAAHECAHVLLARRFGAGVLPLWIEEGLAQLAGWRAAAAFARTASMESRPVPPSGPWMGFDELLALSGYPSDPASVAAFYWQSALLVRAVRARLGPAAFEAFLAAAAAGTPPLDHLREACWFSAADFDWLRRQILPGAPPPAPASAAWLF